MPGVGSFGEDGETGPLSRAIEMAKVAMKVWSDRAAMVAVEASASSRG